MKTYFVVGNVWMMLAFFLFIGRTSNPGPNYTFFGVGQNFPLNVYQWVIAGCVIAAFICFAIPVLDHILQRNNALDAMKRQEMKLIRSRHPLKSKATNHIPTMSDHRN